MKIILPGVNQPTNGTLYWRRMGAGNYNTMPIRHIARSVYSVTLPAANKDFEYYIMIGESNGTKLIWPATAPRLNQTVIVADVTIVAVN